MLGYFTVVLYYTHILSVSLCFACNLRYRMRFGLLVLGVYKKEDLSCRLSRSIGATVTRKLINSESLTYGIQAVG